MEYKLYGQVRRKVTNHGHLAIRFVDEDLCKSKEKLTGIHNRFSVDKSVTKTGLVIPNFDGACDIDDNKNNTDNANNDIELQKPYSDDEFIVKVPKKSRDHMPIPGTFVELRVMVAEYKFEKNKFRYKGWNIILKKISNSTYTQ